MSNKKININQRIGFWIVLLFVTIIVGLIHLYTALSSNQKKQGRQTPLVQAAVVNLRDIPVYFNGLGTVTPIASVTVRTQINGILLRVLFHEGQMVKVGDLLAEIDPRPYLAQLKQYQGQLLRDSALLANARIDLKRYQVLWKQNSIAQQTYATQQALVKQYEGTVETDEGLIAATQLNLIYCHIIAPVAGRLGLRLIDPGNFVQTADTNGIAIINTLNPITVIFSLPEDNIPQIQDEMAKQKDLIVTAYNRQQTVLLDTGKLITIDNEVDPSTGTVRLRAQFTNTNNHLFPNQFVNARLLIKTLKQAMVVPTEAIQYGASGAYVYVVNPDNTVSVKAVSTGVTEGEWTVIVKGLALNQSVVTDGADNLAEGMKVQVAGQTSSSTMTTVTKPSKNWRHLA